MEMQRKYHRRNRFLYIVLLSVVILLGLYSRSHYPFPLFLREYAGDVLWTCMVYLILTLCFPNMKAIKIFLIALSFSVFIEFTQLISTPTLDYLRTTIARYILGQGFVWSDLLCYVVGAMLSFLIDYFILLKQNEKRH